MVWEQQQETSGGGGGQKPVVGHFSFDSLNLTCAILLSISIVRKPTPPQASPLTRDQTQSIPLINDPINVLMYLLELWRQQRFWLSATSWSPFQLLLKLFFFLWVCTVILRSSVHFNADSNHLNPIHDFIKSISGKAVQSLHHSCRSLLVPQGIFPLMCLAK